MNKAIDEIPVAHIPGILHDIGVISGAQLHKNVPGLTESGPANGSPEHGFEIMKPIGIPVGKRIPVAIDFKFAQIRYQNGLNATEYFMVWDVFEFTVVKEAGTIVTRQDHISGIPGKLVFPGIVFITRCHQSARAGFKSS